MNNDIILSIIIPYHNEDQDITERLFSSLNCQNFNYWNNVEIIICNNCKVPQNEKLCINSYRRIRDRVKFAFPTIKNMIGPSRQSGIDISVGKYIWMIDCDDLLYSNDTIRNLYNLLEQNNNDVYLVHQIYEIYGKQIGDGCYDTMLIDADNVPNHFYNSVVHDKIIKRDYIDKIGLRFPTDLYFGEDTFYSCCVLALSTDIVKISEFSYIFQLNPRSASRNMNNTFHHYIGEQGILSFLKVVDFINNSSLPKEIAQDIIIQYLYFNVFSSYVHISNYRLDDKIYNSDLSIKYTSALLANVIMKFDPELTYAYLLCQYNDMPHSPEKLADFMYRILNEYSPELYEQAIERNKLLSDKSYFGEI